MKVIVNEKELEAGASLLSKTKKEEKEENKEKLNEIIKPKLEEEVKEGAAPNSDKSKVVLEDAYVFIQCGSEAYLIEKSLGVGEKMSVSHLYHYRNIIGQKRKYRRSLQDSSSFY